MSKGGISPSGRALRFVLVRLPLGVTRYSVARNTAVMTEEGRRVLALVGFGVWVAVFWYVAELLYGWLGMVLPLQLAGIFGLLLVWRIIGHLRRWWVQRHNLKNQAVSMQRQRQMYEMQTATLEYVRQLPRQLPGGGFTVPGMLRQHDPVHDQARRQAAQDAQQVRDLLPDGSRDIPLGDRFVSPLDKMPRWMRRRGPKEEE